MVDRDAAFGSVEIGQGQGQPQVEPLMIDKAAGPVVVRTGVAARGDFKGLRQNRAVGAPGQGREDRLPLTLGLCRIGRRGQQFFGAQRHEDRLLVGGRQARAMPDTGTGLQTRQRLLPQMLVRQPLRSRPQIVQGRDRAGRLGGRASGADQGDPEGEDERTDHADLEKRGARRQGIAPGPR